MVSIDHVFNARDRRDMSPDHDLGLRRQFAGKAAHFAHLADVYDDGSDADHVEVATPQMVRKCLASGKVEQRRRRADVFLNHHQTPRAVKHAQREWALRPGHLVVIKLHRIDGAATEFIVLRVRAKHGGKQNAGCGSLGVHH